jgi:outer membrane protein
MRGLAIIASALVLGAASSATVLAQQPPAGQPPRPAQPAPATPAQPPATAAPVPAPAPAQPPAPFPAGAKIAYINPPRIFQESVDGKAALSRVNTLTQKKQAEGQAKQKALQDNQQKLQASGGVMSDAARSQLEKEIERQTTDIQRFQQDAQSEIQELQNEVQNDFVKKVTPILHQIATEKGLQLLFNAPEAGFAWTDPGLDLTTEVIKKLDATAKPAATPKD